MRHLIGIGTPRGLQGRVAAVIATFLVLIGTVRGRIIAIWASHRPFSAVPGGWLTPLTTAPVNSSAEATYTTGS